MTVNISILIVRGIADFGNNTGIIKCLTVFCIYSVKPDVIKLIDKSCLDYYYEIDVDELKSSSMPNDELGTLKELGWSFNSDKSKLLVYLKND